MLPAFALALLGFLVGAQNRKPGDQPVGPFAFPGTPPTPDDKPAAKPPEKKPPVAISPSTGKAVVPGLAGHKPYPAPIPPRVVATAQKLLGPTPLGGVVVDSDPAGRYSAVRYRKEPHGGGKVGITAYVPNAETGKGNFDKGGATGTWEASRVSKATKGPVLKKGALQGGELDGYGPADGVSPELAGFAARYYPNGWAE